MMNRNAENERVKREYLTYLRAAKGLSEQSLDTVVKAIRRFEESTRFKSFRKFHVEQAIAFREHLMAAVGASSGKPLSPATMLQTLNNLRAFFLWLAGKPGFKARIAYLDAEYFRLSERDTRTAKTSIERPVPTLDQIHHLLKTMPAGTDIEKRDRALVAFLILTGVRDGSLVSLKLKHIDLDERKVIQDAREVHTKFGKSQTTTFFPVEGDAYLIVSEWIGYLRRDLLFGEEDPLFPATDVVIGPDQCFTQGGLSRRNWSGTAQVRAILKAASARAGLPYFNPHSFRKSLVQLAFRLGLSLEQMKAWSQNLGHSQMLTTLTSYGHIPSDRQASIIRELQVEQGHSDVDHVLEQIGDVLRGAKRAR